MFLLAINISTIKGTSAYMKKTSRFHNEIIDIKT